MCVPARDEDERACLNFERHRTPGLANFQLNMRYCDESRVPPTRDCSDPSRLRSLPVQEAEMGRWHQRVCVAYIEKDASSLHS